MQKKLNEDFIDGYCEKFASKVTAEFFKDGKDVITGKEILKVTPSKQVNFFVIKLLFRYWQEETKKLESPFFNYKHEEVRQAMIQFMNVLSQHIEINKEKFETLLNHAVKDTIYLAAMPQAYVEIDLDSRGVEKIADKSVEGTVKYLKIHKKEIQNFLSDMKGLTIDDVIDELPEEFDDFDTTEAVEEECKLLSSVLDITAEKVFSDDPAIDEDEFDEDDLFAPGEEDLVSDRPSPFKKTAPDSQKESEGVEMNADDEAMSEEDIEDEPSKEAEASVEDKKETEENPLDKIEEDSKEEEQPEDEEDEPKKKVQPPVMLEDDDKEDDFPEETINKQFEKEEESLAEHHEKAPKEGGILELISLNHRYMFIKELFRNDKNEFENALYELEQYDSFDDSVEFLVQGYAKHNEWDMQSDEVKEFLKVLFRRFR
ncbi:MULTISPECIES: hypothetical protein [unclassified Ekhidna]|uniref:hypothetical protein n=1 Tax=unclassified Ekhidna TaxID=2632188 RepID=UPI0032DE845C